MTYYVTKTLSQSISIVRSKQDAGIGFLRRNGYHLPEQRESTHIDRGDYRSLEDKGYLFKYNIPYDRRNNPEHIEDKIEPIPPGLPLYLQKKHRAPLWMLKIDLSVLSVDRKAWEDLQRHPQASITVNAAPFALQQQHLLNIPCLLEVRPETKAYVVQREDINGVKHRLQEVPETPGLFDNYKGNVFVESRQKLGPQANLWRRYLPGNTLSFTGTILWLANANQQTDWPGDTRCIGSPESGWHPSRSGSYNIRVKGDTTSEPHFIRINSATTSLPRWLHGLSCIVTSNSKQQTFHAFQDTSPGNQTDKRNILDQFTQDELPGLMWTSEPEGLPIHITWAVGQRMRDANNSSLIHSDNELTRCWQERICESISNSNGTAAFITLDAGSFGLIELSLAPVPVQKGDEAWWTDQRLCSQLVWLSRVIVAGFDRERTSIAAPLLRSVRQHCEQVQHIPPLYGALQRIATIEAIPQWVVIRLQALLNEIEQWESIL